MESPAVQNGPKAMFFKDYSFLVAFNAYLRSECTTPDAYACVSAGFVLIRSFRTVLGSLKEEEEERRKKMNNSRGRRFYFSAQKRLSAQPKVSLSSGTSPDQSQMAKVSRNVEMAKIRNASLRVAILIYDDEQAMAATLVDFLQALKHMKAAKMVKTSQKFNILLALQCTIIEHK